MKEETAQLLALRAEEEKKQRDAYAAEAKESQDRYHFVAEALGFEKKKDENTQD